ncbi:MAG: hypothetical protein A3F54_00035 [Candidatus Kerfeldbacteria bacterium RIFCSPHIGHO2_12_FULL_48_17]|uniref:Uncharacterized protein n=1 Tax=Candidatus Kerfeldbacteria bacterium RIFCSPHIGHO2_12_FULL_48_17 TaxID=1798542 RepID=A0A1G2B0R0_9BACT|nr:MAG: hypothetical protein A3F54_00035 [Candidatus Kerfeldbacteria bacterium RIFCSPHIGHO2_12_FULL_48_17]
MALNFIDVIVTVLGVGALAVAFVRFGRFLPAIPHLNPWPITAMIFEKRANGEVPRIEKAKSWRTPEGEWFFQTKKSNLKTPPKPFSSLCRGKDGKDYIYLIQSNRENLLSFVPTFNGEQIDMKMQDENTKNWERYQTRQIVLKMLKEQPWYVKNLPIFAAVIMVISAGFFLAIGVQPAIELVAASEKAGQNLIQTMQLVDKVADKLDKVASTLGNINTG